MRRVTVSSIHASGSRHRSTGFTGFSLFTQTVQREQGVLKAKTLKEGSAKNMKIISNLWWGLTPRRRMLFNEEARRREMLRVEDALKKNNSFNLVMQLLSQDKALLNAGDERFTAMLAKRTTQALSSQDLSKMRKKLRIEAVTDTLPTAKKSMKKKDKKAQSFWRMVCPSMSYFTSFTEMQHAIAPTQRSLYACVSKLLASHYVSRGETISLSEKFHTLTQQERDLFSPISQEEAPLFEAFCAANCAGFDAEHFSIIPLFAQFRGIVENVAKPTKEQLALYRGIAASDRVQDSVYFKSQRCLERMQLRRSSDCGAYLFNTIPEQLVVSPDVYSLHADIDDVDVATKLAHTRMNQSVYDDIITRAAVLRDREKQKLLDVYSVDDAIPSTAVPVYVEIKNARREISTIVEEEKGEPQLESKEPINSASPESSAPPTRKAAVARKGRVAKSFKKPKNTKITAAIDAPPKRKAVARKGRVVKVKSFKKAKKTGITAAIHKESLPKKALAAEKKEKQETEKPSCNKKSKQRRSVSSRLGSAHKHFIDESEKQHVVVSTSNAADKKNDNNKRSYDIDFAQQIRMQLENLL